MRFENIFQFIVPLTFFAIWALTSLFNREAQPLPPRSGRPVGPNEPRPRPTPPASPDAPSPVESGADRSQRDPTMRWTKPSAPDRPPGRRPSGLEEVDNDVLRIPAEPARRAPAPRSGEGPAPRRAARPPTAPLPPPRRPEPKQASALSRSMEHDVALPVNRRLVLDAMPESLAAATATDMGLSAPLPARPAEPPPLDGSDLRLMLTSPSKLHQAIILNELLQPPLALRPPSGRRS